MGMMRKDAPCRGKLWKKISISTNSLLFITLVLLCVSMQVTRRPFPYLMPMESFKDMLIRDKGHTSYHRNQTLVPNFGVMEDRPLPDEGIHEVADEDEIPEIEDTDLPECEKFVSPECEKFVSLYLIGKMLGESVPIKTNTAKSKSDWMPKGEVRFVDMGNGFILVKLRMKRIVTLLSIISLGSSRDKFSICRDGEEILIPSKNPSNLLLFGSDYLVSLWNSRVKLFSPNFSNK